MGQIPGQIGLMTAREIADRYVLNEPDRFYHGTNISARAASGGVRLASGAQAAPETDEQFYERKRTESRSRTVGGTPTSRNLRGRSLSDDIAARGVQNPIALGHEEGTGRPDFIAEGHHRLGLMLHLNANQLLPVEHVRSVGEAQGLRY